MITKHDTGFVEIRTNGELLLLTEREYLAASRRGDARTRHERPKIANPKEALDVCT